MFIIGFKNPIINILQCLTVFSTSPFMIKCILTDRIQRGALGRPHYQFICIQSRNEPLLGSTSLLHTLTLAVISTALQESDSTWIKIFTVG